MDDNRHSLNEIAMKKSMSGKLTAVEIGWRVAPAAWPKGYGDGAGPKPHLFVPWTCTVKAVANNEKGTDYPYTLEDSPPTSPDKHRYGGPSW